MVIGYLNLLLTVLTKELLFSEIGQYLKMCSYELWSSTFPRTSQYLVSKNVQHRKHIIFINLIGFRAIFEMS